MKILFITLILGSALYSLIISLDLIMGTKVFQLPQKELNPFQVMEPAEYALLFLVAFFLLIKVVVKFLKKKKGTGTS